jgi:hypothetical protein
MGTYLGIEFARRNLFARHGKSMPSNFRATQHAAEPQVRGVRALDDTKIHQIAELPF